MKLKINKNIKHRLLIFFRSFLIVLFHTTNIYLISNKYYELAILLSAGISIMWTLNVKDLAISDWSDRLAYIFGGLVGTTISLYFLSDIIEKL